MFHVSTQLPYERHDPQKLQRKRHIGNDIVCVVFLEADNTAFSPACIKSHFLHTFILVSLEHRRAGMYLDDFPLVWCEKLWTAVWLKLPNKTFSLWRHPLTSALIYGQSSDIHLLVQPLIESRKLFLTFSVGGNFLN